VSDGVGCVAGLHWVVVFVLLVRWLVISLPLGLCGVHRNFGLSFGLVLAVLSHDDRSRDVFLLCVVIGCALLELLGFQLSLWV